MPQVQGEKGNYLLTDDIIVKEALRLLKNNLVAAPLVHRDLESRFSKVGDTISLQAPFRVKSESGRVITNKAPLVDQAIPFKIDRQEHIAFEVTMRSRTLSLENFSSRYLASGIAQIANQIDRSILDLADHAYFSSGSPGTGVTTKDFLLAKAYMMNVAVPDDGQRRAVLNALDGAEISDKISDKYNPGMVRTAVQRGYMGPLAGFDTFESANIPVYQPFIDGAPQVDGANQTGDTLAVKGLTASTTPAVKAGTVFTIAGVYEINPQSYQSTGRLQRFVVLEDADSDGSGEAVWKISPSINDGVNNLIIVNAGGNNVSTAAYQNVSAALSDSAAITIIGTSNTQYRQDLLFHRDAIALAMVDLELPQSATVKARVRDPDSGLSLCMTAAYDIVQQTEITRIDAVWGTHMIYPHLAHRLFSAVN